MIWDSRSVYDGARNGLVTRSDRTNVHIGKTVENDMTSTFTLWLMYMGCVELTKVVFCNGRWVPYLIMIYG